MHKARYVYLEIRYMVDIMNVRTCFLMVTTREARIRSSSEGALGMGSKLHRLD